MFKQEEDQKITTPMIINVYLDAESVDQYEKAYKELIKNYPNMQPFIGNAMAVNDHISNRYQKGKLLSSLIYDLIKLESDDSAHPDVEADKEL